MAHKSWEVIRKGAEKIGLTALLAAAVSLLVSTLVSNYVSNLVTNHFEVQRDNTRERVQSLLYREQQLDDSHNAIFASLGIYTDKVLNRDPSSEVNKEELQRAIVSTQSKLMDLRSQIGDDNLRTIREYDSELSKLSIALRNVSRPEDLGPVLTAAQKVLASHEKLASEVRSRVQITNF